MSDTTELMQDPIERTALLAAYVAGQCSPQEAAAIEDAVRADDVLAQELELLRAASEEIHAAADALDSPGEFGWYRLKRDIAREKDKHSKKSFFSGFSWGGLAAAAAGVLVVVQLTFWLDFRADEYRTLGDDRPAGVVLQIRFQPDASQQESLQLLREFDAEIISGPSAAGLYRVHIDIEASNAAAVAAIVEKLRREAAVIDYARQEE